MMGNEGFDITWPVQVFVADSLRAVALMNRKAYMKSIENGKVWIVHPATGKVLPWPGEPSYDALVEQAGCYRMDLPEGVDILPYGNLTPGSAQVNKMQSLQPKISAISNSTNNQNSPMRELAELIRNRQAAMPEGSYTAHLFHSGLPKIRKKLGEEAIELILADNESDVIGEACDVIYHLMVLLQAAGIRWADVENILEQRSRE